MLSQSEKNNIVETLLELVSELNPEDVFPEEVLGEWAIANGYTKDEE